MPKENKTFRIEKDLSDRLEEQAQKEGRSFSNLIRGYLEDRVELADQWPAFDEKILLKVKELLTGDGK
jgi:predicted CopG family antitoxin